MRNYPNVHYDFNESISVDLVFSPAKMLHLFLIMKECVNNALKHSRADEIRIRFACEKEFKIEITDNGQGFDFTSPRTGSGIENILYRIKECGWKIEWQKNEKSGTTIYISGDTTN
jgi:signal transduction histidine kinase